MAFTGEHPQVLVVTRNASLVIGLTFAAHGWEISSQLPTEPLPDDADVIVLDLDDLNEAVQRAEQVRGCGVVLLGVDHGTQALPEHVSVLARPFTMEELLERIARSLPGATAPTSASASVPVPDAAGEPPGPDTSIDGPSWSTTFAGRIAPASLAEPSRTGSADSGVDDDGHHPEPSVQRFADRLLGRFTRAASTPRDPSGAADDEVDVRVIMDAHEEGDEDFLWPDAQPAPQGVPLRDNGTSTVPEPTPEPPPPPVQVEEPELTQEPQEVGASAVTQVRLPRTSPQVEAARPAARWRARRRTTRSAAERALQERLARVLAATSELESMLEELPLLADLPAFSQAVISDVARQFEADTAALWRRGPQGWKPQARHGFTRHEATWIVPVDQPLFAEVDANGGAMLIDPVEQVQAAVAGIAGAHTESLMAAAVAVGPGRYGLLVVGRDRPLTVKDLDLLAELAFEAAPGLAVAEQVVRLGSLVERDASADEDAADPDPR